ncbi:Na+/H+ antiporter subunit D [Segetibacter sp. 3557_3]|uniref:proton-conducting transporter transmembrane domain-containing protein n=1 Tax=Segetibacter sp. 3557_3 TaxID=2547429 RepID=UPI00105849F0|nr:proton-conducting transporter membrane subunit [Segetibacter sp. 3557_3]TDH19958.1 Na+/H+ antiporter subunit D [Segetibacter sp. 3557_3]
MTNNLIILPVMLQFTLAIVLLFFCKRIAAQKIISIAGSIVAVVIAVGLFRQVYEKSILTMQAGNWKAPFGITFVADTFSTTMILLASLSALAVAVFSTVSIKRARMKFGYFPSFHFLIMGLNGAFLTGDIFNLYVWFEVIIISSFVFITLGGKKVQIEGAVKYFTLNFLASMIFLTAIAVLYGLAGSLNMADLSGKIQTIKNQGVVQVIAILFLVGFGIKSAIFPLYFWLPDSYHTPQAAISSIFAGLLTKVGIYALLRVFSLVFIPDDFMKTLVVILGGLTLFSGGLGALVQTNMRKMFSYMIVCHIGYMIGGIGMFTAAALSGAVFYLIHDIIVKTNLFLAGGLIYKINGEVNMKRMGSMYEQYPALSLLVAVPLFSLIGVPPLSGFWPKINLMSESFVTGNYYLLGCIIFGSFITLFVITRFWSEVFWKKREALARKPYIRYFDQMSRSQKTFLITPIVFLSIISLYIGLGAENIFRLSNHIAAELVDTSTYIDAVLGAATTNVTP